MQFSKKIEKIKTFQFGMFFYLNNSVDKYLSALLGDTVTICVFELCFSANLRDAKTFAPVEIPTNKP
jgi:hypothetical protein